MLDDSASQKAPPPAESLPPGLADHPDYEVIRELGQGGMGTVYLAKNRLMGRHEVLKVVSKHMMNRPAALGRFLSEIRHAARLHHTNIVTAYSATRVGESIVFAMEYVEGLDLSKLVKAKGPLPVTNACHYIHLASLGLQHAHEMGMIHRDIKPSNLMLAKQGNRGVVKVLDFGLAKVKSEGAVDGSLTHDGQFLGTPEYVAPEQISDARHADIRADIYSLGCTFYYLLTGAPPFQAASLYDLLQAHHSMDALPLNLARPAVPFELAALVAKMMAKEPGRRFQTPRDVAQALLPFFKTGTAGIAEPKPEMSYEGRPEEDRGPKQALSVPKQPTTDAPPTFVAPPLVTSPTTPPPPMEPEWEALIKFRGTVPPPEPKPATIASAHPPRSLWPLALTGLLLLGFVVARAVFINGRLTPPDESPAGKNKADDRLTRGGVQEEKVRESLRDQPPPATADKAGAIGGATESSTTEFVMERGMPTANAPSPAKEPTRSPIVGKTTAKAEFQPLFNGKDKTGWKTHPKQQGNWHVVDGVLIGEGPSISHLYTDRGDYTDFHLVVEARINQGGGSGVFFRSGYGPRWPTNNAMFPLGYEADIDGSDNAPHRTGSVYANPPGGVRVSATEAQRLASAWFKMEVIAYGNHFIIKVNERIVADYVDDQRRSDGGHIALQQLDPRTTVEFRRIEIKELKRTDQGTDGLQAGHARTKVSGRPVAHGAVPSKTTQKHAAKTSLPLTRLVQVREFNGPRDVSLKNAPHGRSDGVYFVESPDGPFHSWNMDRIRSAGTLEVVARVLSEDPRKAGAWMVILFGNPAPRGFLVKINVKGQLFLAPNPWPAADASRQIDPRIGPIVHPAIKPGFEFNKLQLILGKREVLIVVNGEQVCAPVRFDYDVTPGRFDLGATGPGKKRAEFDRLEIREMVQPEGVTGP